MNVVEFFLHYNVTKIHFWEILVGVACMTMYYWWNFTNKILEPKIKEGEIFFPKFTATSGPRGVDYNEFQSKRKL